MKASDSKALNNSMRADWYNAAIAGHGKTIARLIAEGADINSLDRYGQTALMLASQCGCEEVVRVLLSNSADKNVTAKYELSALMLAVINHHTDIAPERDDRDAPGKQPFSGAGSGHRSRTQQDTRCKMKAWSADRGQQRYQKSGLVHARWAAGVHYGNVKAGFVHGIGIRTADVLKVSRINYSAAAASSLAGQEPFERLVLVTADAACWIVQA